MSWNTKPLGFGATSVSPIMAIHLFHNLNLLTTFFFKYRRHLDSRAHQAPLVNQALLEERLPHQVLIC